MGFISDFIEDRLIDALSLPKKPAPKTTAKKVEDKIRTDEFRYDENTIYPGGTAKDIPWSLKNMHLQYKCIRDRLLKIQIDLEDHGMTRDAEKIEDILRQIDDHEERMYNQLSDKKKNRYYELPGFYNDYNLS